MTATLSLLLIGCIKEVTGDTADLRIEMASGIAFVEGKLEVRVFSSHDKVKVIEYNCPAELKDPNNVVVGKEYPINTSDHYGDIKLLESIPLSAIASPLSIRKRISLTVEDPYTGTRESATLIVTIYEHSVIQATIVSPVEYSAATSYGAPVIDTETDITVQFNVVSSTPISSIQLMSIKNSGWLTETDEIIKRYSFVPIQDGIGTITIPSNFILSTVKPGVKYSVEFSVQAENEGIAQTLDATYCYLIEKFKPSVSTDRMYVNNYNTLYIYVTTNKNKFSVNFEDLYEYLRDYNSNTKVEYKTEDGDWAAIENMTHDCEISIQDTGDEKSFTQQFRIWRYRFDETKIPEEGKEVNIPVKISDKTVSPNFTLIRVINYWEKKSSSMLDMNNTRLPSSNWQNDLNNLHVDAYENVDKKKNVILFELPGDAEYEISQSGDGNVQWAFIDPDDAPTADFVYSHFSDIHNVLISNNAFNNDAQGTGYGRFLLIKGDNKGGMSPGGKLLLTIKNDYIQDENKKQVSFNIFSRYSIALDIDISVQDWVPTWDTQNYTAEYTAVTNPNSDQYRYVPMNVTARIINIKGENPRTGNISFSEFDKAKETIKSIKIYCVAHRDNPTSYKYAAYAHGYSSCTKSFVDMMNEHTTYFNGSNISILGYTNSKNYGIHAVCPYDTWTWREDCLGYYPKNITGSRDLVETIQNVKTTQELNATWQHSYKWNDWMQITYDRAWKKKKEEPTEWKKFFFEFDVVPDNNKCVFKGVYQRYLKPEYSGERPWWVVKSLTGGQDWFVEYNSQ